MIKRSLTEASVEGISIIQPGENELIGQDRRLLHAKQCVSSVSLQCWCFLVPGRMETKHLHPQPPLDFVCYYSLVLKKKGFHGQIRYAYACAHKDACTHTDTHTHTDRHAVRSCDGISM